MLPPVSRIVVTTAVVLVISLGTARASTTFTFSRDEVNTMANLWETDCVSVSPLPSAQYPTVAGTWDFIFPHSNVSADGDIHVDMAISSSGTGATSNNTGASPLICEVVNATQTQLTHLTSLTNQQATFRGVFRLYTEHAGERHFELHPVTQLQRWNGSTFVQDTDYLSNIVADPDGTTHGSSVLAAVFDGSQTVSATIAPDNVNITFVFPSPSVNYVQYVGAALSGLQSDALGQYFLFRPDLVPSATVRCRLIANSGAASAAAGLAANQSVTVNALTRTDISSIAAQISAMNANDQKTFARPIELIVLGLPGIGPGPTPTPTPSPTVTPTPTPTPNPTPTPTGSTFANISSVAISGSGSGKGTPYPDPISISGLVGKITKVTAQLNGLNGSTTSDWASDVDVQMVGPYGQNVMLISDAGGSTKLNSVTLAFDDAAASSLSNTNTIVSGTYKPTNYSGDSDSFPSPAPTTTPGTLLSVYNNLDPNGIWNLFVIDEYSSGKGTLSGGWSLTIQTMPSAPLVTSSAATGVSSTTATVNGTIDPLGLGSTYHFEIGTDTSYGFTQIVHSAGSGTAAIPVALNLSGLRPATTYHYRLTGGNSAGTASGMDRTFTTAAFLDSDGDGMPNDFETANGLNPNSASDASIDSDGDGMTNLQEYLAGTNPRAATSVLRVSSIENSGGDIVVTFPSVLGKIYMVEQGNSLAGPWFVLSDKIPGTNDLVNVSDVEAADAAQERFYRVTVTP
jgi:hypothetical protein